MAETNTAFWDALEILPPAPAYDPWALPPNPTSNDILYRELKIAKWGHGDLVYNYTRAMLKEDGFMRQIMPCVRLESLAYWLSLGIPRDQLRAPGFGAAVMDDYVWIHEQGRPLRSYYRGWFDKFYEEMLLLLRRMTKSEWKYYYARLRRDRKGKAAKKKAQAAEQHNQVVQAVTQRLLGQIATLAGRAA